jgi:hypothetical protein
MRCGQHCAQQLHASPDWQHTALKLCIVTHTQLFSPWHRTVDSHAALTMQLVATFRLSESKQLLCATAFTQYQPHRYAHAIVHAIVAQRMLHVYTAALTRRKLMQACSPTESNLAPLCVVLVVTVRVASCTQLVPLTPASMRGKLWCHSFDTFAT